jgi:prophage antirepressor-like protein
MEKQIDVWDSMTELLGTLRGMQTDRLKETLSNFDSEWESMGFDPDSRSRDIVRRCLKIEIKRRRGEVDAIEPVKSASFGNISCDFYHMGDELWMTREQVGSALGYTDPRVAITKIHDRHKDRLSKCSTVTKLVTVEGNREVSRNVIMYNARGIYEICRWSQQPKADEFFDWVYDILEGLRKGELALQGRCGLPACTGQPEPDGKYLEAQAKLLDARTRQAKLVHQMAKDFKGMVGAEEVKYLISEAMNLIRQG